MVGAAAYGVENNRHWMLAHLQEGIRHVERETAGMKCLLFLVTPLKWIAMFFLAAVALALLPMILRNIGKGRDRG